MSSLFAFYHPKSLYLVHFRIWICNKKRIGINKFSWPTNYKNIYINIYHFNFLESNDNFQCDWANDLVLKNNSDVRRCEPTYSQVFNYLPVVVTACVDCSKNTLFLLNQLEIRFEMIIYIDIIIARHECNCNARLRQNWKVGKLKMKQKKWQLKWRILRKIYKIKSVKIWRG